MEPSEGFGPFARRTLMTEDPDPLFPDPGSRA